MHVPSSFEELLDQFVWTESIQRIRVDKESHITIWLVTLK